jgi:alginate O-acetyltransferase complex protein AlgI
VIFSSEAYLVFLPAVFLVYWLVPRGVRPAWLLTASYWFYAAWNPPFVLLIIGLTIPNYFIGLAQARLAKRSRALLLLSLVVDVGALAIFKYLGFMDQTANQLAQLLHLPAALPAVHIFLPLGLSFFTFEFVHYQVDVYRGDPPVKNPIHFALFPAFFPTQIAGPIKRYQDFNAQVEKRPRWDPVLALEGVELIALGLFKKVVLAETLAGVVGAVYGDPAHATRLDAWAGLTAFYLQVYFDFSGYTDIGRGSAQLLGYRVPINFLQPYLATSMQEFWRRWHMSLSFWLRDYIYKPLGGSRGGKWRERLNLLITVTLGGLWHGAAWTFIGMGVGFGISLISERLWRERTFLRPAVPGWLGTVLAWLSTQFAFLTFMQLFRAPSIVVAAVLSAKMLVGAPGHHLVTLTQMAEIVLIFAGLITAQRLLRRWNPRELLASRPGAVLLRPAYALGLGLLFTYFFAGSSATPKFIYFQF